MLKTVIFLSIIVKLAFGEEVIDGDVDDDEMTMSMDLFEALATCEIDESDELTPIEAEIQKNCLEITKKSICLKATSGLSPGPGIALRKRERPNQGNDGPGECVYIEKKKNKVARILGAQCVSPAAVRKTLRKIRRRQNFFHCSHWNS